MFLRGGCPAVKKPGELMSCNLDQWQSKLVSALEKGPGYPSFSQVCGIADSGFLSNWHFTHSACSTLPLGIENWLPGLYFYHHSLLSHGQSLYRAISVGMGTISKMTPRDHERPWRLGDILLSPIFFISIMQTLVSGTWNVFAWLFLVTFRSVEE